MKKVLFTATVDSHILHFHLPFLKYFKEQGYEVHVATNGEEEIPYCDRKIQIPFERSPFKWKNIKAIGILRKVMEKEEYDLIHCHTPMGSVVTRIAAKKERKKGTKVFYTAHGFHFYKGAPILNWALFYPVEKYLCKHTDTIITINQEDFKRAKKKFKKTHIAYVPGVGIDQMKFDQKMTESEKEELRQSLGLQKTDFIMVYPAELNRNKNQILLLEVMRELTKKYKNMHLLLAGIDSYNGYYQQVVRDWGLSEYVHFLGYRKDVPKLLQIADLSVSSSLREGLPVNVIEALYMENPIVAFRCRGMEELILKENGFIVDSKQEFIERVEQIYTGSFSFQTRDMNPYLIEGVLKEMDKVYKAELSKRGE